MRAHAEGQVRRGIHPIKAERPRIGIGVRIAVRRRDAQHDVLALRHRNAADLAVLARGAEQERHRRLKTQGFVDRRRYLRRIVAQVLLELRVAHKAVLQIAQHVGRGQRAGEDVHHQRTDVMGADAPAAVVLRLNHCGDQVVRRVGAGLLPLNDQRVQGRREFREGALNADAALGLAMRRPGGVQKFAAPLHHLVVLVVRHTHDMRGDGAGQHDGQRRHQIAAAGILELL